MSVRALVGLKASFVFVKGHGDVAENYTGSKRACDGVPSAPRSGPNYTPFLGFPRGPSESRHGYENAMKYSLGNPSPRIPRFAVPHINCWTESAPVVELRQSGTGKNKRRKLTNADRRYR
jgi:hypothetical protein